MTEYSKRRVNEKLITKTADIKEKMRDLSVNKPSSGKVRTPTLPDDGLLTERSRIFSFISAVFDLILPFTRLIFRPIEIWKMIVYVAALIFITGFIDLSYAHSFLFTEKTVPVLELGHMEALDRRSFHQEEERHQLCYYAKKEAKIPFLDYNFLPRWQYLLGDNNTDGINCGSLPSSYLLMEAQKDNVQITFVKPGIDHFKFNTKVIEEARVSPLQGNKGEAFRTNSLVILSLEDRKNLCFAAKRYLPLVFLHGDVPEAQAYEMVYASGRIETHVAIYCPTLPKLYLHLGASESEVKIVRARNIVDQLVFEVDEVQPVSISPLPYNIQTTKDSSANGLVFLSFDDREDLCVLAREYNSLPVKDIDIYEAQWFLFAYHEGKRILYEHDMAIVCSERPSMYLRWDSSDPHQRKIKINFFKNPFDRYWFRTHFHDSITVKNPEEETEEQIENNDRETKEKPPGNEEEMTKKVEDKDGESEKKAQDSDEEIEEIVQDSDEEKEEKANDNRDKKIRKKIRNNKVTALSEEDRWNLCFQAQKRLPYYFNLFVIPKYVDIPRVYEFHNKYPKDVEVTEQDIAIKCSSTPEMYVRYYEEHAKAVKISFNLKDFQAPKLI